MHAMKLQTQLLFFATAAALVLVAKSHDGGMDVVVGSGGGAFQGAGQAAMLPMHALRLAGRVEEDAVSLEQEEEAAFPRRRVLYGNEFAGYNSLGANKAACYGPCPGRGQPYSGRGCQSIFGCNSVDCRGTPLYKLLLACMCATVLIFISASLALVRSWEDIFNLSCSSEY